MIKSISLLFFISLLLSPEAMGTVEGSLGFNGGVNDNPHNLSKWSTAAIHAPVDGGEEQICIFCHTPHGSPAQSTLWNRPPLAQAEPPVPLPLYSGDLVIKGNLGPDPVGQVQKSQYTNADPSQYPNGSSRMCMSCHDGVTAVGTVLNGHSGDGGLIANLSMSTAGTIDLAASHPISFVYNAEVVGNINSIRGVEYQLPPTYNLLAPLVGTYSLAPLDSSSRMQCTTCHEPHFNTRHDGYLYPFWRNRSATGNAIDHYNATCNECHLGAPVWDPPLPVHGDGLDEFGNPL